MSDILIKVDNVSKKFAKDLKKSLLYGIADVGRGMLGKPFNPELREGEFWAVRDVSFEVRRGECLGLIGHNGAGKSTLLKMLNGLIRPDKGRIEMRGRIGALIELGAGFNPILTGRENIYNSGAVLGFTRAEINKKFDEIVAFSELEDFLDMPVQSYSSGMRVRLGFAVAAQLEPDVLLIDEVLAVGDVGFQWKCLNRITSLLKRCAVIFVSHSMAQVGRICTEAMLLEKGITVEKTKDVPLCIERYFSKFTLEDSGQMGALKANLLHFSFLEPAKYVDDIPAYARGNPIKIRVQFDVDADIDKFVIFWAIIDQNQRTIALASSMEPGIIFQNIPGKKWDYTVSIDNLFTNGKYILQFDVFELLTENPVRFGQILLAYRAIGKFYRIEAKQMSYTPIQLNSIWQDNGL